MFWSINRVWPGLKPSAEGEGDGFVPCNIRDSDFGSQSNNTLSVSKVTKVFHR
jgi:hypothetical protein